MQVRSACCSRLVLMPQLAARASLVEVSWHHIGFLLSFPSLVQVVMIFSHAIWSLCNRYRDCQRDWDSVIPGISCVAGCHIHLSQPGLRTGAGPSVPMTIALYDYSSRPLSGHDEY